MYLSLGREREEIETALPLVPAALRPIMRVVARTLGFRSAVRIFYLLAAWRSGQPCLPDPGFGAGVLAYLGDRDGVLRCLEKAIDTGRFYLVKVDPTFDPYRDDPRFEALLARIGLAD